MENVITQIKELTKTYRCCLFDDLLFIFLFLRFVIFIHTYNDFSPGCSFSKYQKASEVLLNG